MIKTKTVVHVTHEAIQRFGGIATVLQGPLTSKVYLNPAPRYILSREQLMQIGRSEREQIEDRVAKQVADELFKRLPRAAADFESLLERSHALADKMSCDTVAREYVVPGLHRAAQRIQLKRNA